MPNDQLGFELELRDEFARKYPASAYVLDWDLQLIQTQAGMNFVTFEDARSAGEPDATSMTFEAFTHGEKGLMLWKPTGTVHDRRDSEYDVVGQPLPQETADLLNGLYGLIGAETVRDDRQAGEPNGFIIRRGEYQGTPIYLQEYFGNNGGPEVNEPLMRAALLGSESGPERVNGLTGSQDRRLFAALGAANAHEYFKFIKDNNVDKYTFDSVIGVLEATAEAVGRGDGHFGEHQK